MDNSDNYGKFYSKRGRPSTLEKAQIGESRRLARLVLRAWGMRRKDGPKVYPSPLGSTSYGTDIKMSSEDAYLTVEAIVKDAPAKFVTHLAKWYLRHGVNEVEIHNEPIQYGVWRGEVEEYLTRCGFYLFERAVEPPVWKWNTGT